MHDACEDLRDGLWIVDVAEDAVLLGLVDQAGGGGRGDR